LGGVRVGDHEAFRVADLDGASVFEAEFEGHGEWEGRRTHWRRDAWGLFSSCENGVRLPIYEVMNVIGGILGSPLFIVNADVITVL
jgi:hypothetical protein